MIVAMHRNALSTLIGGSLALSLACSSPSATSTTDASGITIADGTTAVSTTGETTPSTTGATTIATGDTGTTISETNPDDTADDTPLFDVQGGEVDMGGKVPFVGIPQTCAEALSAQSTVGCSFHAAKLQNFTEQNSSVVIGNVTDSGMATVQLYFAAGGVEGPIGGPVEVAPGQAHEFVLTDPPQPGDISIHRIGGTYRVESDIPLVAYQHSPINAQATNDSSLLIPDHALGQYYIVATWETTLQGYTSAFNVIGIEDNTVVQWTPPNPTIGGNGVDPVAALDTGMATINHFDLLQVLAPLDASGTIIETSKPAWVVGTIPCVNVPQGITYCDHMEELLIPLDYWGVEYVGAHAPNRGSESYWWRIYSASDGVTITTNPPQPGTPIQLDRGQFHEFSTQESFIATADGPFMPVQYLEGTDGGAGTGDPAAYQMVPAEQFLPRYVFITGTGYTENYAQIIRPQGGAAVTVDGIVVDGYYDIGGYEVADWLISEGAHIADSDDPFGVIQVGYTGVTSYAYPGGLALGFINPNPEG
jgi:hypothetical protein